MGLDFYLKEDIRTKLQQVAHDATLPESGATSSDDPVFDPREARTSISSRLNKRMNRLANELSRELTHYHRYTGLKRWQVVPLIVLVLTLVVGMCGRLAALTEGCRHTEDSNGQSHPHWMGRWCLYQAFPLLTALPGSPSACACAVLFVRGPRNKTESNHGPCDKGALTQLHDDLVNEDLHIAKYLHTLIHYCPSQHITETEDILAAPMNSMEFLLVQQMGGALPLGDYRTRGTNKDAGTAKGLNTTIGEAGTVMNLTKLLMPRLVSCYLQDIPLANPTDNTFALCVDMHLLYVGNVGWTRISTGAFETMVSLLDLQIVRNEQLTNLPSLVTCTALGVLILQHNKLERIGSLDSNTKLRHVKVQHTELVEMPSLAKNTMLEEMNFDHSVPNRLTIFPSLDKHTLLTILSMGGNQLEHIPRLASNTKLKGVWLNQNNLATLPNLDTLTALNLLYLDNNRIRTLPNLNKLTMLKSLRVHRNRLSAMPSLSSNTALEDLTLDNNRLGYLSSLDMNSALTRLTLDNNRLSAMPSLRRCTALTALHIFANRITSWASLTQLTSLSRILVQSNRLTYIPAFINHLPALKYLDVSDNAINSLATLTPVAVAEASRNETTLLLGRNPVCDSGMVAGHRSLGGKWFASCQSQCSRSCPFSVAYKSWFPGWIADSLGNGQCDIGCNTTGCSYDSGDCLA